MQFKFLVIRSQNRVFPRLSFPISLVLLPHQELKAVQDEMAHPGLLNPSCSTLSLGTKDIDYHQAYHLKLRKSSLRVAALTPTKR